MIWKAKLQDMHLIWRVKTQELLWSESLLWENKFVYSRIALIWSTPLREHILQCLFWYIHARTCCKNSEEIYSNKKHQKRLPRKGRRNCFLLILMDHSSLVNGSVAANWKEEFWLYHSWTLKVKEEKSCQHQERDILFGSSNGLIEEKRIFTSKQHMGYKY